MTITIPERPDQVVDLLNDSKQVGELLKAGQFGDVIAAYAGKTLHANSDELLKSMQAQLQADMGDWLKDHPGQQAGARTAFSELIASEAAATAGFNQQSGLNLAKAAKRNKLFSKTALGAQLDETDYAKSIGAFLGAVLATKKENSDVVRAFERNFRNAMSERVPSSGGFLVPEVLRSQILMIALESAVIRPRARIIPMDSLRIPYPTIDDTSHTNSVFGGVQAAWTEEGGTFTPSQPSFGRIVIEAKKLTAYTTIPNELMSDAVAALDQWFNEMFPMAVAFFEDVAFITGSGVGQPQGFQNSPGAVVGPARAGGAGAAVQYTDIATMYSRMWPASHNNAVWICSPDVLPGLMGLVVASGVAPPLFLEGYQALGLPGGSDGTGYQYRLLGRPLLISEKMPALASQGCLAYVDLGYYLLGDRQTMQVANSDEFLFANDLTAFRVIERVDGRTWLQSPITPQNGSANTLSPVVLIHA